MNEKIEKRYATVEVKTKDCKFKTYQYIFHTSSFKCPLLSKEVSEKDCENCKQGYTESELVERMNKAYSDKHQKLLVEVLNGTITPAQCHEECLKAVLEAMR